MRLAERKWVRRRWFKTTIRSKWKTIKYSQTLFRNIGDFYMKPFVDIYMFANDLDLSPPAFPGSSLLHFLLVSVCAHFTAHV